jgi:hypothetical protein
MCTLDKQIDPSLGAGAGCHKEDNVFDNLSISAHNFYLEEVAFPRVVALALRQSLNDFGQPLL